MTKKKFVSFDWVIKYMLRDKTNYVIVEGFLSELLKQQIKIQEILESEENKETAIDKYNRVDILIKNQADELIIIELQYEAELDYFQRILYGTSKLITEYINEGEAYSKVKKIISVSLVYFDLGLGDDYLYHGSTTFRGMRCGDTLHLSKQQQQFYQFEQIADIYPEYYLIKLKKFANKMVEPLDEWLYFLKNENILDTFTAQGLHEAKEQLEVLKLSEQKRQAYKTYQENLRYKRSMEETQYLAGYQKGQDFGYQKGQDSGYQNAQYELAKKLLNSSMDLDEHAISNLTGLDLEIVKKLRDESKKSG
jgi:predicted transposase/invertase (TIGR01784 family)